MLMYLYIYVQRKFMKIEIDMLGHQIEVKEFRFRMLGKKELCFLAILLKQFTKPKQFKGSRFFYVT